VVASIGASIRKEIAQGSSDEPEILTYRRHLVEMALWSDHGASAHGRQMFTVIASCQGARCATLFPQGKSGPAGRNHPGLARELVFSL
jgi:hypothetical protein